MNIVMYKRLAEIAGEYLKKGSQVYIEGRLETQSWEKDGVKQYKTQVVANEMKMLGGKEEPKQTGPRKDENQSNNKDDSDEIPF